MGHETRVATLIGGKSRQKTFQQVDGLPASVQRGNFADVDKDGGARKAHDERAGQRKETVDAQGEQHHGRYDPNADGDQKVFL